MPPRPDFTAVDRCWLWLMRLALRHMSNEAARWTYEVMRWGYIHGQG